MINANIPNVKNHQLITIITEFDGPPDPSLTLTHCKMPEGKTTGFLPYKDDGGLDDYTNLYKYMIGEETDTGETYPISSLLL